MTKKKDTAALSEHANAQIKKKKKGVSQKAFTIQATTGFTLIRMRFRTQCSDGQRLEHEFRHIPQANPHFATFNVMQSQNLEKRVYLKGKCSSFEKKQKNIKR